MVTVIKKGSSRTLIKRLVQKLQVNRGVDVRKYAGVIKLKEHPLTIQKKLRDEWE